MTTQLMNGVNTDSVVYSDSMVIVQRGDWLEHLGLPFMARTVIERLPRLTVRAYTSWRRPLRQALPRMRVACCYALMVW